jgi:pSer/pThr/pTyr-binding forkhead associated (FHA) protein
LVLPDGRRIPLADEVTIGRASGNTVQLIAQSVSRHHARISPSSEEVTIEDAGSSLGTWVDGRRIDAPAPLHDGAEILLGGQRLVVEGPTNPLDAGHTIVALQGASRFLPQAGAGPRLRSGWALKRLEAAEGEKRWVLKSLRTDRLVRLADSDAELVELLDGHRTISQLITETDRRLGAGGSARLAGLLSELADRGFLADVDELEETSAAPGRLARLMRPHELVWPGAGAAIERLCTGGGRLLVAEQAATVIAVLAATGMGVFGYLVAGRYGTPFVVARKVGLGALVFLVGRLAIAAVHEAAHGVVMASFGRRVHRAGVKLIAIFPFVFVDTSDAWFEPRARRITISAAGPASDFTLAAVFSLCCLALPPGPLRDVFFQLALAAYVGALFNLNPFVDRDGYQILVDVLREPGLRTRAREQMRRWARGEAGSAESRVLIRYSLFGLAWTVVGIGFGAVLSLRYKGVLAQLVPLPVAYLLLSLFWVLLATPLFIALGGPLLDRLRAARVRDGGP